MSYNSNIRSKNAFMQTSRVKQFDNNGFWWGNIYITLRDELFVRVLTFEKGYEVSAPGLQHYF